MANTVNFNGFEIAPEFLDETTRRSLQTLGLTSSDPIDSVPRERFNRPITDEEAGTDLYLAEQAARMGLDADPERRMGGLQTGDPLAGVRATRADLDQAAQEIAGPPQFTDDQTISAMMRRDPNRLKLAVDPGSIDSSMYAQVKASPLFPSLQEPSQQNLQPTPFEQVMRGQESVLRAQQQAAEQRADILERISRESGERAQQFEQTQRSFEEARAEFIEKDEQLAREFDRTEVKEFWDSKSTGERILAAIAVGLSGLGQTLAGQSGPNQAFQIIQQAVENFRQNQLDELQKIRAGRADNRNALGQLIDIYQNELAALSRLDQMAYQQAQIQLDKVQAMGVSAQTDGLIEQMKGQLRQQEEKARMETIFQLAEMKEKASNQTKIEDIKDAEWQSAGFALRAEQSEDVLDRLEGAGFDAASVGASLQDMLLPERMKSDALKQYHQAAQNWVSAILRKESGAAISDEEFAREFVKYFPLPGDSPEVQQQKKQSRLIAASALRAAGQRALPYVSQQLNQGRARSPNQGSSQEDMLRRDMQIYESRLQQNPGDTEAAEALRLIKRRLGM